MMKQLTDHDATESTVARATTALTSGHAEAACALFKQAISEHEPVSDVLDPELFVTYSAALFAAARFEESEAAALHAVQLGPEFPDAWSNLGVARQARGSIVDALEAYRIALELAPDHLDARVNLAIACVRIGKVREARTQLLTAIELAPNAGAPKFELGRLLLEMSRPEEALPYLESAIALQPGVADSRIAAGVALRQIGRLSDAVGEFEAAARLAPRSALPFVNLARVQKDLGNLDAAIDAGRTGHALAPRMPAASNNLASAYRSVGMVREAAQLFAEAECASGDLRAASNRLCAEQYLPDVNRHDLLRLHRDWASRYACERSQEFAKSIEVGTRPLRVGFVSPDLGQHPIGFFLLSFLNRLCRDRIETVCYSDRSVRDEMTVQVESSADLWRETSRVSDAALAKQIRRDEIDLLIDLAGHTSSNRLQMFADRAAPVQATWLGYTGTTGVDTVDYLIADEFHVRPGEERDYVERIARMPNGYLCYAPPKAPPVGPLPALANGFVTFGAFHNPAKISSQTVALWAELLKRIPSAVLKFKYFGFDSCRARERVCDLFGRRGITEDRLHFAGATSLVDHLGAYSGIDVTLDPLPYSGGLTTCESVWMGVPVVTLPGETFAGRHSCSHLHNAGLPDLVAKSSDDYVNRAVSLVGRLDELASLRESLRDRVAESKLCDGEGFASDFTDLVEQMVENV